MKNIFQICLPQLKNKLNLSRHLKIAIVVGTVLNLINQFNSIIILDASKFNFVQGTITYFVPFLVSIYSAATFNHDSNIK
jgi:hypothetical protein